MTNGLCTETLRITRRIRQFAQPLRQQRLRQLQAPLLQRLVLAALGDIRDLTVGHDVRPVQLLLHDVLARGGEQHGATAFVHGILHERLHGLDADFTFGAVRLDRLVLLARDDAARVRGEEVRRSVWLQPELTLGFSARESEGEHDLAEFGAGVEFRGPDVGVDFGQVGEGDVVGADAVEFGGLHDDAAVRGGDEGG